jgi:hypothetical protein
MRSHVYLIFSILCALGFNVQAIDIDVNNNGVVDESYQETNVLLNANFDDGFDNWTMDGVTLTEYTNQNDLESLMLTSEYPSSYSNGYIEQSLELSELGFSDVELLDYALSKGEMKVVFGAWHASVRQDVNDNTSSIKVIFKDGSDAVIGAAVTIPPAGTMGYEDWVLREAEQVIPEGTRNITFRVDLNKSDLGSSHKVRFDDAYLNIRLANDSDADGILDSVDVDLDNDGVIDNSFHEKNLLINSDFNLAETGWTMAGVTISAYPNQTELESLMLTSEYPSSYSNGYIEQSLELSELGFSDVELLDYALSSGEMKVVFGAWHASLRQNVNDNTSSIKVIFKDGSDAVIGAPITISRAGTMDYDDWVLREAEQVIPEGTRSITFRVDLNKSDVGSGHKVRFDDAYLYISSAQDEPEFESENEAENQSSGGGAIDWASAIFLLFMLVRLKKSRI